MTTGRVEYTDIDEVPEKYSEKSIVCSVCNSKGKLSEFTTFECSDCGSKVRIQVVDDYYIVSQTNETKGLFICDMPELPKERKKRLQKEYGVSRDTAEKVTSRRERADFYERLSDIEEGEIVGSLLTDVIFGELNYRDMEIEEIEADDFEYLVNMIKDDSVTDKQVTDIIRKCLDEEISTEDVFEKYDYGKTSVDEIDKIVDEVVQSEKDAVDDYNSGEGGALNYLVGQVMSESGGGADAQVVREKLIKKIDD